MSHKFYKPARARLHRSELAVPGSSPKMFEKALNSKADVVFLDLEDAVSPNDKLTARKNTIKSLNSQVNLNADFSGTLKNLAPEAISAKAKSQLFIDNNYINGNKEYKRSNFNCRNKLDPRDSEIVDLNNRVSFCSQACHSIPLIFKNFYMKISDHMLLGGEHMKKISPGFNSPIVFPLFPIVLPLFSFVSGSLTRPKFF